MMNVTKTEQNVHRDRNIKEPLTNGEKYEGICCCCRQTVCRKNMWAEYTWMGCPEVYGDMLQQCFCLDMILQQNNRMYICELCITMLRSALYFRRQVVRCFAEILKQIATKETVTAESNRFCSVKEDRPSEEAFDSNLENQDEISAYIDATTGEMEEVHNDDDIKLSSIRDRLSKTRPDTIPFFDKIKKNSKRKRNYIRTRQNICLMLEHSTLIPFRSNKGYFNCFYCSKQYVVFDDLKSHMAEIHNDMNSKGIMKCILRPDIIKADCSNITCKLCLMRLVKVEDLIEHLTNVHNIVFNYDNRLKPKDCILPYNLSDGRYRCSVCGKEFLFFKTLSKHMNDHSANYVCEECGKCFFLPERLRAHKLRHLDKSSTECDQCGKVCPSNIILRSHIRYNHKKVVYVCSICDETFKSFKERLKHMETVHGRKLNLSCEFCGKGFNTPCSLNVHVRSEHLNIVSGSKFPCEFCPMMFKSRSALKCHGVVHSGERNFECNVCYKRYGRSRTLEEHMKIHRNDKRWSCAECGQAFIQKCSLRNHIRVHHSSQNGDLLILYKMKPILKC